MKRDFLLVSLFLEQEQTAELGRYKVLLDDVHECMADISSDTHFTDQKVSTV